MNNVEKPSRTRNATIIMILVGLLLIYTGFQFYQIAIIMHDSLESIYATLLILFGVLSFCTSLAVFLEKSWAPKMITGVGVAVCVTQLIFGFYLIIVVFAIIYYLAWNQLRQEIEDVEWFDALDED